MFAFRFNQASEQKSKSKHYNKTKSNPATLSNNDKSNRNLLHVSKTSIENYRDVYKQGLST